MRNHQESPSFNNTPKIDLDGAIMFDTETGRGDSSVLENWKKSCRTAAGIALSKDPLNKNAVLLRHWARQRKFTEPDMKVAISTFKTAGLMAFSFFSEDQGTEVDLD